MSRLAYQQRQVNPTTVTLQYLGWTGAWMGILHYGTQCKHYITQHKDAALASLQLQGRTRKQNKPRRIEDRATTEFHSRHLPKSTAIPTHALESRSPLLRSSSSHPSIKVDICVAPGLEPTFVPTYLVVPRHWSSWARICDSTVIVYYQVWLNTRIV